jgi:hypothetical protein
VNFPRALRIIVALALLSAQQAALSHQLWHLLDHGAGSTQEQLCDQHEALGTVAGALDAPVLPVIGQTPANFSHCFVALPAAKTPGLAPSSRGPPALL